MKRNLLTGLVVLASGAALMASPAGATHNHYLRTPGGCHQVAAA